MAIKKKDEVVAPQLPAKLGSLLTKAFGEQFLAKKFEDNFKETKGDIEEFLLKEDFDITVGKSTTCPEGAFNYIERRTLAVDKDKLIGLIESKKVTLAQVLACVSTFKNEDLEKAISTVEFAKLATESTSKSLQLRANAAYKSKMEDDFAGGFKEEKIEEIEEIEEIEVLDVKKISKKKSKKVVDVDDELDSILNS